MKKIIHVLAYNWGQLGGKFTNFGDKAMLESTLFIIDSVASNTNYEFYIYIPTTDKKFSETIFKEYLLREKIISNRCKIEFFKYNSIIDVLTLYQICNKADIIIVGGCALVQSNTSIWYHLFNILPLIFCNSDKKIILWGVSIDKIEKLPKFVKEFVIKTINKADYIIVRDKLSYNNIKKFISRNKLLTDFDLCFYNPIVNNLLKIQNCKLNSQNEKFSILIIPRVIFELNKYKYIPRKILFSFPRFRKLLSQIKSSYLEIILDIVKTLKPKNIDIVPFWKYDQIDDIKISKSVYKSLISKAEIDGINIDIKNTPPTTINLLQKIRNKYDIIITSTFHGTLLSIIFGKSCYYIRKKNNKITLGYYGKIAEYLQNYCNIQRVMDNEHFEIFLIKRKKDNISVSPKPPYKSKYYEVLKNIVEGIQK
jgi:polysaccharide pyruvyl transferase WcaK-like protein